VENIVNYKVVFVNLGKIRKQCGTNAAQSLHMLENTVNYRVFEIADKNPKQQHADKCGPEPAHVRKQCKLRDLSICGTITETMQSKCGPDPAHVRKHCNLQGF
jgi:hypothetical protein